MCDEPKPKVPCLEITPPATDGDKTFEFSHGNNVELPPTPGNHIPEEEELMGFDDAADPFNIAFNYGTPDSSTSLPSNLCSDSISGECSPQISWMGSVLELSATAEELAAIEKEKLEAAAEIIEEIIGKAEAVGAEILYREVVPEDEGVILDKEVVPETEAAQGRLIIDGNQPLRNEHLGIKYVIEEISGEDTDDEATTPPVRPSRGYQPANGAVRVSTILPIILNYAPVPVISRDKGRERSGIFPTSLIPYESKYFGQVRCLIRGYSGFKELKISSFYDKSEMIAQKFPSGRIRVLRNYTCVTIQHRENEFRNEDWAPEAEFYNGWISRHFPTSLIPRESTYYSGLLAGIYLPGPGEPSNWIHKKGVDGLRTNFKLEYNKITVERDNVQIILYEN